MKDDVLARIQRALDERTNLEEDLELQRTFATDPQAAQVASELAAIDEALRDMRDPVVSEADLDRLVHSIEERLDDALEPMADPTAPPALDDDDPVAARTPEGREETLSLSALGAPERSSLDSLPPELLESLPPESPADLPPRPVASKPIERPAVPRGGAGAAKPAGVERGAAPSERGERFSFTSVAPPPPLHRLPPVSHGAPAAKPRSRAGVVVALFGGTLAVAAGALLVVMFSTMGGDEDLAYAPPGPEPGRALQLDEAVPLPGAPVTVSEGQRNQGAARPEANGRGGSGDAERLGGAEGGDGVTGGSLGIVADQEQERPALVRRAREAIAAESRVHGTEEAESDRDSLVDEPATEVPADPADPPAQTSEPSGPRGATPSREEVIAAMRGIVPAVAACGGGARSGVAEVRIRVGGSGRVQSSVVIGQFAGTPEGSCIARAARGARFRPFAQDSFEFTYPFRLD